MACPFPETAKKLAKAIPSAASKLLAKVPGFLLIVFACAVSAIYIHKASGSVRLTDLENALFQVISLSIGILGVFPPRWRNGQRKCNEYSKASCKKCI